MSIVKGKLKFPGNGYYKCPHCGHIGKKEELETDVEYDTELSVDENIKGKTAVFCCHDCNLAMVAVKLSSETPSSVPN